jgi:LacI family repressor for deo operon, udp, cdd, tsx, nupC, and nupG
MREVARLAGVSVQTVSHVVNRTGNISDATRERVAKVIDRIDYRPNPIARSMRTRETGLIGLLVLDITSPVLSTIASEVEAAAHRNEYKVILYNARHDARLERESLETFAERLVDGLVIVNAIDGEQTLSWLEKGTIPTVLVDCLATAIFPSVTMDNLHGAYLATEHLLDLDHRRIVHLSGDLSLEVGRLRVKGYLKAMGDHGLAEWARVVKPGNNHWDYEAGYLAMRQVLGEPERPTAVFAAADQVAIGAYRAIAEAGLAIPDDISVVGFDGIPAAEFSNPPLTTIRQPLKEIGGRAFELLLELLDKSGGPRSTQIVLQPRLLERDSTRRLA